MQRLAHLLRTDDDVAANAIARRLVPVLCSEAGVSSAGFPFLAQPAYAHFRDTVPHVLAMGDAAWRALDLVAARARAAAEPAEPENLERTERVTRTMLNTAAITAPPDLWLLRHVLGSLKGLGLLDRLLAGEAIDPAACRVRLEPEADERCLSAEPLAASLRFLCSRGYVWQARDAYVVSPRTRAQDVMRRVAPVPEFVPAGVGRIWCRLFEGQALDAHAVAVLARLGSPPAPRTSTEQSEWTATLEEIELGYRVVPIVLGLRHAHRAAALAGGEALDPAALAPAHPELVAGAGAVLRAAGAFEPGVEELVPTPLGRRVFGRGPGPFGIIETYHPYMTKLRSILLDEREAVWVNRTANVAASQSANSRSFEQCNDALDAFCAETGFTYDVFIEHALGRGEATRQRWERSRDKPPRFFGADLEYAAVDAAAKERDAGRLPEDMVFVRGADIGEPATLLTPLAAAGAAAQGAVMMVGNGFHEVRNQTHEKMQRVFRGYHDAGIVLIFTEANAFTVADLLDTAWNTYHAGFMYVHQLSGQGLRPARRVPAERGDSLPESWAECAESAGYVRAERWCTRSRTAYPTGGTGAFNPAISVNHMFVPGPIAARLGLGG